MAARTFAAALSALAFSASTFAVQYRVGGTLKLDDRQGCDTAELQIERLEALKAGDSARHAQLSASCKRLAGPFLIQEVRPTQDGEVLRVAFGSGSLWVHTSPLLVAKRETQLKPDFRMDPWKELDKLERGDLALLRQIKLSSGEDIFSFVRRRRLTVVHKLSDVACREKPTAAFGDGCWITIHVTNGRVRNVDSCSNMLRWRRPLGETAFVAQSGGAQELDADEARFLATLEYQAQRCGKH